jgi:hypothetical protein
MTFLRWAKREDYGNSRRVLPVMDFSGADQLLLEPDPRLVIDMFADGYRARPVRVALDFVSIDDWRESLR